MTLAQEQTIERKTVAIEIAGETFDLLPERALFRRKNRSLLVADLHWGKAEVFQRAGIAVSSQVLPDDLERLSSAIEKTGATRLIILGDLIHAPKGVTPDVTATVNAWREKHSQLEIDLIRGNHDRNFELPDSWRIQCHAEVLVEPPFFLTHDEIHNDEGFHLISGHIHPVVKLRGSGDSLRLPCFAISRGHTLLPAFSAFTGGQELRGREWKRIFVLTDNAVIEI